MYPTFLYPIHQQLILEIDCKCSQVNNRYLIISIPKFLHGIVCTISQKLKLEKFCLVPFIVLKQHVKKHLKVNLHVQN